MNRMGNKKKKVLKAFRDSGKKTISDLCDECGVSRNWGWEILNKYYQNLFYKIGVGGGEQKDFFHYYIAKFNIPRDRNTIYLFLRALKSETFNIVRGENFASNLADELNEARRLIRGEPS